MAERVKVKGEISKVESFTTSGGGVLVKLRIPNDGTHVGGDLLENIQRIADITFTFRKQRRQTT